jgi:hypothetical protein
VEQYYVKRGKKYVKAGFSPDCPMEGLYYKSSTEYSNRTTSINYWMGATEHDVVDLNLFVNILKNDTDLASYLMRIQDVTTKEHEELQKDLYYDSVPKIGNIAPQDLAIAILKFLYKKCYKEKHERPT